MAKDRESNELESTLQMKVNDAKIVRKVVLIILTSLTLILFIGIVSGYIYIKSALGPVNKNSEEEIQIEIPLGSSTTEIAHLLEENGLIKSSSVFRFYIKFKNYSDFQAGEYTLTPALHLNEIVNELQNGKVMEEPIYRVTIPEGKTIEQIAEIFEHNLTFTKEDFLSIVNDEKYINELIDQYPDLLQDDILNSDLYMPLEGYLFAGTYDIFEEEPS